MPASGAEPPRRTPDRRRDERCGGPAGFKWRVISAAGNHGLAVAAGATGDARPVEILFRRRTGRPLPGDRVRLDADGAVEAIAPRANVFGRGGRRGRFRPIAANLDTLLIVIAAEPAPSVDLLHRYISAARILAIAPLVVVHKFDLQVPDAPPFSDLDELDVEVLRTRCEPDVDLDGLPDRLGRGTHLLAGQSGVGKSSLANALLPDLALQTERLSRATGKGRHTTTGARLFRLPAGGWLVDTPGVWEYGLWCMGRETLARGFPEFASRLPCRFRDCSHREEPGCRVREAAGQGLIPASRYRAWLSQLREQQRLADGFE
ncbi:MAG: ribosome small subunit-dependent GTPase A [Wenzhouxiangellaceae bacterium]|nr:ribosome small subunit-dependent GTPase A [Wenzhouxiangellaceae bacterium]